MEGSRCFMENNCDMTGLEPPVWDYGRGNGDRTIIGGFVYRGDRLPELYGLYIYADFISGRVWSLEYDGINETKNRVLTNFDDFVITSFGVDEDNELYICAFDGNIYQIVVME